MYGSKGKRPGRKARGHSCESIRPACQFDGALRGLRGSVRRIPRGPGRPRAGTAGPRRLFRLSDHVWPGPSPYPSINLHPTLSSLIPRELWTPTGWYERAETMGVVPLHEGVIVDYGWLRCGSDSVDSGGVRGLKIRDGCFSVGQWGLGFRYRGGW
eukprot:753371-Hanusia_phi.AAC.1